MSSAKPKSSKSKCEIAATIDKEEDSAQQPVKKQSFTISGLTVHVRPDVFDDIDIVDLLGRVENSQASAVIPLLRRVLGDEYDLVKKHLEKDGVTKVSDFMNFFNDLANAVNALEAKNS